MWREMRRKGQQLTHKECEEVLAQGRRGVLAVLGDDGYPYALPLNYVYADGRLHFHGAVEGHKLDAITSCDRCSFCVLSDGQASDEHWWLIFRSVIAFGLIRLVDDPDAKRAALWELASKYFPTLEGEREHIERSLARTAVLELEIEHLTGKLVKER